MDRYRAVGLQGLIYRDISRYLQSRLILAALSRQPLDYLNQRPKKAEKRLFCHAYSF